MQQQHPAIAREATAAQECTVLVMLKTVACQMVGTMGMQQQMQQQQQQQEEAVAHAVVTVDSSGVLFSTGCISRKGSSRRIATRCIVQLARSSSSNLGVGGCLVRRSSCSSSS
jgi:hypothetical protein